MRYMLILVMVMVALLLTAAAPAENLSAAKAKIAEHQLFAAVPLLQKVIDAPEAGQAQVEEALVLQSMIFCGDVVGAGLVMRAAADTTGGEQFKALVGQQLMGARRGFADATASYLNATVGGSKLTQLKFALPDLSAQSIQQMEAGLKSKPTLQKMLDEYSTNPAAAQGLLGLANHYGLYGAASDAASCGKGTAPEGIQSKLAGGVAFSQLYYLDWLATVALQFHKIVKEPNGPDLLGLAKRCDERLKKVAGGDAGNKYVKNAQARAKQY